MSQHPISCANGSGFPLQIKTSSTINKLEQWRVLVEEHPWSSESGDEGYIDIIAERADTMSQSNFELLVIECKRVRHADWVFLVPKFPLTDNTEAVIWGSSLNNGKWSKYGWDNLPCDPSIPQSEYCAIPGQEHGRNNLLERSASELVESVEALASQEKTLQQRDMNNNGFVRFYIPVLVTTARILVACSEPATISLAEGTLPKDSPYEEVPYIKFHKGLGRYKENSCANTIKDIHKLSQRSVFIVNAKKLSSFLKEFKVIHQ